MVRAVLIALSVMAAGPASTPISAGRWAISNQMEEALFNGQRDNNPFPPSKPSSVCLAAAAAARGPGLAFVDGNLCKILKSTLEDGAFAFETECKSTESDDVILTKSAGHYSADSYTGTSTSVQRREDMRIEMRSRVEAKRVGDCQ